jgi:hypothetical protein
MRGALKREIAAIDEWSDSRRFWKAEGLREFLAALDSEVDRG